MGNRYDIAECRDVLEMAIGEIEYHIPTDVLEQTIAYLWELENMKIEESWRKFPDGFY